MTFTIPAIEKNLAPLSSAIGMLEYWNNGIMGFAKMAQCFIARMALTWISKMLINDQIPY